MKNLKKFALLIVGVVVFTVSVYSWILDYRPAAGWVSHEYGGPVMFDVFFIGQAFTFTDVASYQECHLYSQQIPEAVGWSFNLASNVCLIF